jgi:endonuclease/exonuclease/phosphatase family metal-dependent hydrolase
VARLTLATYNIHRCYGADGRFEPERVARVLRELTADVVALQEVETFDEGGLDLLADLGWETGLTAIPGPTLAREGARYGNALMTRLAPLEVTHIDLSVQGREPRGAIDARLDAGERVLRVCATHLGLKPVERRAQIKRLLASLVDDRSAVDVLMGDLNEWFLWGRPLRWLRRFFEATPAHATFPARWPVFALDRVWVRPRHLLQRLDAHRSPMARIASDHLPLRAELALDRRPGEALVRTARRSTRWRRVFGSSATSPRLTWPHHVYSIGPTTAIRG